MPITRSVGRRGESTAANAATTTATNTTLSEHAGITADSVTTITASAHAPPERRIPATPRPPPPSAATPFSSATAVPFMETRAAAALLAANLGVATPRAGVALGAPAGPGASVPPPPSQKSTVAATSTTRRSKAHRAAVARQELLRLQIELAAAKLKTIEAEESDEEGTVVDDPAAEEPARTHRIQQWVDEQQAFSAPEQELGADASAAVPGPWPGVPTQQAGGGDPAAPGAKMSPAARTPATTAAPGTEPGAAPPAGGCPATFATPGMEPGAAMPPAGGVPANFTVPGQPPGAASSWTLARWVGVTQQQAGGGDPAAPGAKMSPAVHTPAITYNTTPGQAPGVPSQRGESGHAAAPRPEQGGARHLAGNGPATTTAAPGQGLYTATAAAVPGPWPGVPTQQGEDQFAAAPGLEPGAARFLADYAPEYGPTVGRSLGAGAPPPAVQPTPAGAMEVAQRYGNPLADLTSAITTAIAASQQQRRPPDLPVFAGSHQYWLSFSKVYNETVNSFSECENLNRLRNSVKGRAREAVEQLFISGASARDIVKVLENRFGRPDAIALGELERLRALPRLNDNPRDVCVFASRVCNIVATLRALGRLQYLYNPEVTKCVIEKLSFNMRYRWFDFAATQSSEEADLLKLARFLEREADICAPYAPPETVAPPQQQQYHDRRAPPHRTLAAVERPQQCPICNGANHGIASECTKFTRAAPAQRWEWAREKRLCFRCLLYKTRFHSCKKKLCGLNKCDRYHHRLLHQEEEATTSKASKVDAAVETVTCAWARGPQSYLKILPVRVKGPRGCKDAWALLDDGSTVTLMDERLAEDVGASGPVEPLRIEAIADTNIRQGESKRVKIELASTDRSFDIEARTVRNLSLSAQRVDEATVDKCDHLQDIKAELIYSCAFPRILIGQDNWHLLVAEQMRRGRKDQPVASLTPLGWILHGAQTRALGARVNFLNDDMHQQLQRYFELDNLVIQPARPASDPEEKARKIMEATVRETEPGVYEAGLLWKNEKVQLPYNYDNALSRLHSVERKIDKDVTLRDKYESKMEDFIIKGYAEPAPATKTPGRTWYLPHFGVTNPQKPEKLRVVHDAAAKTKGIALNTHLMSGPDLLQSLPGVMMRFRQHAVAVTADIAEMFMRVKVREEDRDTLRYLWRGRERGEVPPTEYRMTSLIFGATCSPSIAIYVKNFNATKHANLNPRAAAAIVENHYVDDYLDSFRTTEEAIEVSQAVKKIHSLGNFDLRGWSSNSAEVSAAMEAAPEQPVAVELTDGGLSERVLGLIWTPATDQLSFNLDMARVPPAVMANGSPTKREALRIVMSLYDPMGLASPVTVRAKSILQETWRRGVDWDQRLPDDLAEKWKAWLTHLQALREVSVPRAYPGYSDAVNLQLHVFSDSSESAYSAALYWRAELPNGRTHVSLVLAKARVAPLKLTSVPRLELQAAVMGARMADVVKKEHQQTVHSTTYWTDSKTVLQWLRNGARTYRPFVAHRIAAIEELSKVNEWRWVPTKQNAADDATRDVPENFNKKHRWYVGPSFLTQSPEEWPVEAPPLTRGGATPPTGEEKVNIARHSAETSACEATPDASRFSKWEKLLRATARIIMFTELVSKRESINYKRTKANAAADPDWRQKAAITPTRGKPRPPLPLTQTRKFITIDADLLRRAERLLIRAAQQQSFSNELRALRASQPLPNNNKFKTVAVALQEDTIVLASRIAAAADVTDDIKRPPVLDGRHGIARLYINFVHRKIGHAGVEPTINETRQRYWIIHLRSTARQVIHRCLVCRIRRTLPPTPPTGDHPACRLAHHQRPFTHTGVDYFGPLSVTVGRSHQKRYVALFTCLTTRAIHLEVAHSLTTDSAIMALRRMVARRGCPAEIWSDNGTNLRGADKELRKALDQATEEEASQRGIRWRFIPAGAPFFGGAWEKLVRSAKAALEVTLHERHPSDEVLITLLAEAEFTINSRPLTHVSLDPDDPEAITPNHILLGGSAWSPPPGKFEEEDIVGRTTWRTAQKLADNFWARWLREYLPELQNRREPQGRGPPLSVGDLVFIADGNLPRNTWPRGKVIAVYPGPDGIVRAADVQTKAGVLRRPTKKLAILPTAPEAAGPAPGISSTPAAMNGGSMCRTQPENR